MTTQPDRERKRAVRDDDDHDPILGAAEDLAQLLQAQEDGPFDAAPEPEDDDVQPVDDPSWETTLRARFGEKTDEEIVAQAQGGDSVAWTFTVADTGLGVLVNVHTTLGALA